MEHKLHLWHAWRRLVCTLLSTCGQYFSNGTMRRKLDRYLAYFQRYLLAKPPLPLDVEFDVQVRRSTPLPVLHTAAPSPNMCMRSADSMNSQTAHYCYLGTICVHLSPFNTYAFDMFYKQPMFVPGC